MQCIQSKRKTEHKVKAKRKKRKTKQNKTKNKNNLANRTKDKNRKTSSKKSKESTKLCFSTHEKKKEIREAQCKYKPDVHNNRAHQNHKRNPSNDTTTKQITDPSSPTPKCPLVPPNANTKKWSYSTVVASRASQPLKCLKQCGDVR